MICPTCDGCGAIFVQHRTGLDDPKMEYIREACPGPNLGRDGTPCPFWEMETRQVGESSFSPKPDVIVDDKYIHATISDGRRVSLPIQDHWNLASATNEQRQNFKVGMSSIHWTDIDEDIVAESFGGTPSRVFPDHALAKLVELASKIMDDIPQAAKDVLSPLLRRVCYCSCHYDCGDCDMDGKEPSSSCGRCGQSQGPAGQAF